MTISKKSMKWIPWILILPVVIIRGFTTLYPIIVTLKNSLFDIKVLSGVNEFVGLANYVNVFKDPKVQTSISFTVIFVVVSMVFHVVLGVILALILNMKFKGRRFLRTIVLIPWAMPAVVIGMAAKWGFNNDYGLVNDFIRRFVSDFQYNWLINTSSARAAVIAIICGKTFRSLQSWYCPDFSLFPGISTKLQRWMGQTECRASSVSHYR